VNGLSVLLAAALLPIKTTSEPAYVVTSVTATIRAAQVVHEGAGEDGDGAATVALTALTHPQFRLPPASRQRRLSVRVGGSGAAQARFDLGARPGGPSGHAECSSVLTVGPRAAPVTFLATPAGVRIRLALPYVSAPFVEASDLYPATGPCDANTGARPATLVTARTFNRALFSKRRVTLTFASRRTEPTGDVTYTTTWRVTVTLTRR